MQYVARQPILDGQQSLKAYELLFRDSLENRCPDIDPELASKRTLDTAVLVGLDALSDGHEVFVNFTHDLIVAGFPRLFPPDLTVVEILESAQPSPELLNACKELKRSGYRVALDDFQPQPGYERLIDVADVIKVDFRSTPADMQQRLASAYGTQERILLAEKIETEEEFRSAVTVGYSLFQGYLFSRPNVLTTAAVAGLDANQARILKVLSRPHLNYLEVETAIKADPALCYRLLRFLNSPTFYLHFEVRSILSALTLLGEQEMRRWLLLVCAATGFRASKAHLFSQMLVRARFGELLGLEAGLPGSSLFILGFLSLMDTILDIPAEAVADMVAISADIRAALKGERNKLRQCLEVMMSFEAAEWSRCEETRRSLRIPDRALSHAYLDAVRWARSFGELV